MAGRDFRGEMHSYGRDRRPPNNHRRDGPRAGASYEMPPHETLTVRWLLPTAARQAQHDNIAARTPRTAQVRMHATEPYGMRGGRAICPQCGRENRAGAYDALTGVCTKSYDDCTSEEV